MTDTAACCLCCVAAAERGELDHELGAGCPHPPCDTHPNNIKLGARVTDPDGRTGTVAAFIVDLDEPTLARVHYARQPDGGWDWDAGPEMLWQVDLLEEETAT